MARRLKAIARWINYNLPEFRAEITRGYCSTDRKIPGTRLRHPGKGREGNRLIIYDRETNKVVLDHNSAETYRTNEEVEEWIQHYLGKGGK